MTSHPSDSPAPTLDEPDGRIVTFYSYKGGVGRSMALANVAVILAKEHGLNVSIVDWDLDAPGLHRYFGIPDEEIRDGIIDYFYRLKELLRDDTTDITPEALSIPTMIEVREYESGGQVLFLPAGDLTSHGEYVQRVTSFDWAEFYEVWYGGQIIEYLRRELKRGSDVALIDSRTGITDIGGICTLQLPDAVVLVFAYNEQNISGTEEIARAVSASNPVRDQPGRGPDLLFLPARKDLSEIRLLREWERQAAMRFGHYLTTGDFLAEIRESSVPYVPFFSYGERIAAETSEGSELTPSLRRLAQALVK